MRKIKDLCVVTRSYTHNGQDKRVWKNVGGIYLNDEGQERYRLDAFFNFSALRQDNSDSVWLSAFPVKQKDNLQDNGFQPYDEDRGFFPVDENNSFNQDATIDDEMPF